MITAKEAQTLLANGTAVRTTREDLKVLEKYVEEKIRFEADCGCDTYLICSGIHDDASTFLFGTPRANEDMLKEALVKDLVKNGFRVNEYFNGSRNILISWKADDSE